MAQSKIDSQDDSFFGRMMNYSQNTEVILLKEIMNMVASGIEGTTLREKVKSIFSRMCSILFYFGINYTLSNKRIFGDFFYFLFRFVFYRKITLNLRNASSDLFFYRDVSSYFSKDLSKKDESDKIKVYPYNGVNMYLTKNEGEAILEFVPFVHSSFVKSRILESIKNFEDFQKSKKIKINTMNGNVLDPRRLFPSRNYVKTADIVKVFFKASEVLESFSSQAILLDGEPGLGKTDVLSYISYLNLCKNSVHMDMTNFLHLDFKECVQKIRELPTEGSYVILIDELDKHLDHRIRENYSKKKAEFLKNKESKNKEEECTTTVEVVDILSKEEIEHSTKRDVLNNILNLIQTNNFKDGVIFIFSANNFDTIFDGLDITHFESLYDRFLKIRFEKCNKHEFGDYIRYLNNIFKEKYIEKYISEEKIEEELLNIKEDLSISFRDIHKVNVYSCYDLVDLIERVNSYEKITLKGSSSRSSSPSLSSGESSQSFPSSISEKIISKDIQSPLFKLEENNIPEPPSNKSILKCKDCGYEMDRRYEICEECDGILCEDCFGNGYCEELNGSFCKEHYSDRGYEICERCEDGHIHNDVCEKGCMKCEICCSFESSLCICHLCGKSICRNGEGCSGKIACIKCSDSIFSMCKDCIDRISEEKSYCYDCGGIVCGVCIDGNSPEGKCKGCQKIKRKKLCEDIMRKSNEKREIDHISIQKDMEEYNLEAGCKIDEDIYRCVEILSKEYCGVINDLSAISQFLALVGSCQVEDGKVYVMLKFFEFLVNLNEDSSQHFFSVKKLADVILDKLNELRNNQHLVGNVKFVQINHLLRDKISKYS